eukprot:15438229-Alexandrium_andersonii.AAC.1
MLSSWPVAAYPPAMKPSSFRERSAQFKSVPWALASCRMDQSEDPEGVRGSITRKGGLKRPELDGAVKAEWPGRVGE